ncbi:GNAT family N-acetyltransferase [Glutamicibacter arilaitensis]|uniref:GNAT family N-acetyltransferase n=1 Tax=Glutamicibacter arilaitensis TaxID=256701 RepID=UPI003850459F
MTLLKLIEPSAQLHESWLASNREWNGEDQQGASVFFAEKFDWDLEKPEDFACWVALLNELSDDTILPPQGFVNQSTLWLERDGHYLGAVSLRHELINDALKQVGGHIGYGLRPSARGAGLAKRALGEMLEISRRRGLEEVLLTCADSNIASARTIESCGGVLERICPVEEIAEPFGLHEPQRRYWIKL